ncbi:hypothetical protein SNEBB_009620 [Seison nebaliae]|nr:hypothetical protein SNEBB_009620 [Seison nebaliae]
MDIEKAIDQKFVESDPICVHPVHWYQDDNFILYLRYLFIPIIAFGIIGNILVTCILIRLKHLRRMRAYRWFACLGTVDSALIVIYAPRTIAGYFFGKDVRILYGSWGCRLHAYMGYVLTDISSWILIGLAIDRMVIVMKHTNAFIFSFRKKICRIVLFMIIVMSLINTPILMFYRINIVKESSLIPTSNISNITADPHNLTETGFILLDLLKHFQFDNNKTNSITLLILKFIEQLKLNSTNKKNGTKKIENRSDNERYFDGYQNKGICLLCGFDEQIVSFLPKIWVHTDAMIYVYLPFILMSISSIAIIHRVHQSRQTLLNHTKQKIFQRWSGSIKKVEIDNELSAKNRRFRPLTSYMTTRKKLRNDSYSTTLQKSLSTTSSTRKQVAITLILLDVFFIILCTPIVFIHQLSETNIIYNDLRLCNRFYIIAQLLFHIHHAFHFLVYCLATPHFRQYIRQRFQSPTPLSTKVKKSANFINNSKSNKPSLNRSLSSSSSSSSSTSTTESLSRSSSHTEEENGISRNVYSLCETSKRYNSQIDNHHPFHRTSIQAISLVDINRLHQLQSTIDATKLRNLYYSERLKKGRIRKFSVVVNLMVRMKKWRKKKSMRIQPKNLT